MLIPFQIEHDESMPERQSVAWVTLALLALCVGAHLVLYLGLGESARHDLFYRFGASRFQFRWWAPLSCVFLHGSWLHLAGNMFFLWLYGRSLEKGLGSLRFAGVVVFGAYVSVGIHLMTVSAVFVDEPAIGASGAISALLGAFLVLWPRATLRCLLFLFVSFRPLVIEAPAFIVLGLWFAGQLVYSLKLVGDVGGVAFWAHVAGFAWGAGAAYALQRGWMRCERAWQRQVREPLFEAWDAWQRGDGGALRRAAADIDPAAVEDTCGACSYLLGLADLAANHPEQARDHFVQGCRRAHDYRCDGPVLSLYLQLLKCADSADIPWDVHRAAGYAAVTLHQDMLALGAFSRALQGGCTQGLDAMARAVRGAQGRLTGSGTPADLRSSAD